MTMDIKDILNNLGLDLSNPEVKRGALEAIDAILNSRTPPPSFGGGSGGSGGGTEEVELDPDLLQPSQKHSQPNIEDDIEIEDEENILDQIKHNEADSELDKDSSKNKSNLSDDSIDEIDADEDPEETDPTTTPEDTSTDDELGLDSEEVDSNDTTTEKSEETETTEKAEETETAEDSEETEADEEAEETEDTEDSEVTDSVSAEEPSNEEESEGAEESEDEGEFEEEEFEDEIVDDSIKDLYNDEETSTKQEARKIKRERTLKAAKAALDAAIAKKASATLIHELEGAINALEALTEAVTKSLKDISDEEFNMMVNRVFDAIEALGDSGLTFKSDKERELQAQEIKADLSSTKTQQELSAEDIAQIRAETQAVQAREKEANKYKTRAASSFKGFQDFLSSLYRAIALQVHIDEVQDDTWSAINRRHSGSGVLQPGKRINELPNKKIPVIDFYFDCSGSWTDRDLAVGQKAVSRLVEMEEAGQIKINIFYFSDDVFTDAESARAEGGTSGWNSIVKNVITTKATNVIIMTDSDMENWWYPQKQPALKYTVPGYVWYLWRDGENAPRCARDLKGRGGTQQFSFSTSDA